MKRNINFLTTCHFYAHKMFLISRMNTILGFCRNNSYYLNRKTCMEILFYCIFLSLYFYFHHLKDHAFIVDTPGIGECGEMSVNLQDYLSEAVAFIYVIDVSNYGGVHRDRVNVTLFILLLLSFSTEKCFDCNNMFTSSFLKH